MSMTVILAEKPSVAKNIADALKIKTKQDGFYEGPDYIITWAFGHLLQLFDAKDYDTAMARWKLDNFPFVPDAFQYKIKSSPRNRDAADPGAKKQIAIVKRLMQRRDVGSIVSACDYDREGQLIGDSIINYIKPNKPVYRLLLNEWTEQEVLRGLQSLRPNTELQPLYDAGIGRQWADWVIGINLTSVATLRYQSGRGQVLNIGRVLLPTLKIIYDRDKEISEFKPEPYFKLLATFRTPEKKFYEGVYKEGKTDKFKERDPLQDILQRVQGKQGQIKDKQTEEKKEFCPPLFNLSGLQGYMTARYSGWTSDKVLKVAQTLYEKKYITYPRTSSTALEESLVSKAAGVLKKVAAGLPYEAEIKFSRSKRVFNNTKVSSHSAIIPTYVLPKRLTPDQELVYTAIKNRFIMQFMPVAVYEETTLETIIPDVSLSGSFISKGRIQLIDGWKKVEKQQTKETLLPDVQEGMMVDTWETSVTSHMTQPPKPHTERTLLRVMETCGKGKQDEEDVVEVLRGFSIGTAATRAETIKKLKDIHYISNKGKELHVTDTGKKLVETFPVKPLFDLNFTGRLEKTLADIEDAKVGREDFLEMIFSFTKDAVQTMKQDEAAPIRTIEKQTITHEVLGKCPACGGEVVEGYKGFGCKNYKKTCSYIIWKNDKFLAAVRKKPTKTMVKALLKSGTAHVKGMTSKRGKKFSAYLSYEKNEDNDYYSWKMEFEKK